MPEATACSCGHLKAVHAGPDTACVDCPCGRYTPPQSPEGVVQGVCANGHPLASTGRAEDPFICLVCGGDPA